MNAKKTKIMDSVRLFQEVGTKLFGAIERNGKSLCILCGDSVCVVSQASNGILKATTKILLN